MKRPMMFFSCSECSGAPLPVTPTTATCGFTIDDERFQTLANAPKVKLVGVVPGSKRLSYLRSAMVSTLSVPGFVFDPGDGTGAYCEPAPKMSLPIQSTPFRNLLVATSASPAEWKMFTAPPTGEWILKVTGGNFTVVDAGQIPGINDVGASSTTVSKGALVAIVGSTVGGVTTYTLRKMTVTNKRVLVGDTAGGDLGYKILDDTEYLEHPRIKCSTSFQTRTFEGLDGAGSPIVGGLDLAVVSGSGGITDSVRMVYSPGVKRILKEPARVASFTDNKTLAPSPAAAPATSYTAFPGGHLVAPNLAFNYPQVKITAVIWYKLATANTQMALFRDGVQVYEWQALVGGAFTLSYIDTAVTLASHTYDIRVKRGSAAVAHQIVYSSMTIETLG